MTRLHLNLTKYFSGLSASSVVIEPRLVRSQISRLLSGTLIFLVQEMIEFSGLLFLSVAVIPQTARGTISFFRALMKTDASLLFVSTFGTYLTFGRRSFMGLDALPTRVFINGHRLLPNSGSFLFVPSHLIATWSQLISLSHWYLVLPHLSF